jgi:hypothetical protein
MTKYARPARGLLYRVRLSRDCGRTWETVSRHRTELAAVRAAIRDRDQTTRAIGPSLLEWAVGSWSADRGWTRQPVPDLDD